MERNANSKLSCVVVLEEACVVVCCVVNDDDVRHTLAAAR